MLENLSIRKIIDKISSGEIRIPSFQRGFVWEPDSIAFFMDSLYKGYPIGAVLLWRTREQLVNERSLGRFILPKPTKDCYHTQMNSFQVNKYLENDRTGPEVVTSGPVLFKSCWL